MYIHYSLLKVVHIHTIIMLILHIDNSHTSIDCSGGTYILSRMILSQVGWIFPVLVTDIYTYVSVSMHISDIG